MQITSINNYQINHKAVNEKYYQWAVKESKGVKRYGELLTQLRYDVFWGDIHPQDGIDTVNAIKKLMGCTNEFVEHVLDGFRALLK